MLRTLTIALVLLLCAVGARAQAPWTGIISPNRATNWTGAGIPGGLPDASWTQCGATIAAYSGTATQISNQLLMCGSNQYVLLGPGSFTLSTAIIFPANLVGHLALRGSGAQNTQLNFTGATNCGNGTSGNICIVSTDGNYPGDPTLATTTWTGSYAQGATQVILGSVSGIVANQTLLILNQCDTGFSGAACSTGSAVDNGGYFVCALAYTGTTGCSADGPDGQTWRANAWQQEVVQVTAINAGGCGATCVTINQPLEHPNWASGQSPIAILIQPIPQDGVENLSMDGTSEGTTVGEAIGFQNCFECWVSGVRISNYVDFGIYGLSGANYLVQNNYIYHGGGTTNADAYGIRLSWTGNDLVQNNIIQQWKNSFSNDGPAAGEVLAYNFSVNQSVNPSQLSDQMWGAYWAHAAGDDFELREGNIGDQAQDDNVHGSHLSQTNYRNFFTGWESCKNATTGGSNCGASAHKDQTSVGLVESSNVRYENNVANVLGTFGATVTYVATAPFAGYAVYNLGGGTTTNSRPPDPLSLCGATATSMCWDSYDTVHGSIQCNTSEVPTSAPAYPNSVPTLGCGGGALPASFYLASKPSWFGSLPWPPIGPDVAGGNIGQCTGTLDTTNQAGLPATAAGQCGSGTIAAAWGGHVNANPAMTCYLAMGGLPDGTGPLLNFTVGACPYLAPPGPATPNAQITWANIDQVIDGFGAGSMAYSEVWTPTILNQFYTTTGNPGLGLTMVRIKNVAAANAQCYGPDAGCVSNSLAAVAIDDVTNAQNVLALNPSAIIWTSAEYVPTTMMSGSGYYTDNPTNNTALANIDTAFLQLMTTYNVPIYAFSPLQEPDTGASGYPNGTSMTPANYTDLLPYLRSAFNTAGYNSVKILVPEPCCTAGNFGPAVGTTPGAWFNPIMTGAAAADVNILANQGYGPAGVTPSGPDSYPTSAPTLYGLHYWQTEISDDQAKDDSVTSGLNYAQSIHDYLVNAGASSWNYWLLDCTGSYSSSNKVPFNWCLNDSTGTITKRAYMLGQYARFIRPGMFRIDATPIPQGNVTVSAYRNTSTNVFAIVATNQSAGALTQQFTFNGVSPTSVTPYTTSTTLNLAAQSPVNVSGGVFTYTLPAQSVTTFTGTGAVTGNFTCSPLAFTFGSVIKGTPSSGQTLSCTNNSGAPVTVSSVSYTGVNNLDFSSSANSCTGVIANLSTCTVTIMFTPSRAVGTAESANVNVTYTGASGSPFSAPLTGTSSGVIFIPTALASGTVTKGTTSSGLMATINNFTGATLTFTGVSYTGPNNVDFASSSNTCTGTLTTGNSCTVTVTFSPTAPVGTNESATLNVAYTGSAGSPILVPLTGTSGQVIPFAPGTFILLGP